jgi:hypothetical protein
MPARFVLADRIGAGLAVTDVEHATTPCHRQKRRGNRREEPGRPHDGAVDIAHRIGDLLVRSNVGTAPHRQGVMYADVDQPCLRAACRVDRGEPDRDVDGTIAAPAMAKSHRDAGPSAVDDERHARSRDQRRIAEVAVAATEWDRMMVARGKPITY